MSDLLSALWGIPVIRQAGDRLLDQLADDFWRQRATGERVAIISWGALIAGGTIAGLLSQRESRTWALDRINGQDIPVPGVDGFHFRIYAEGGMPTGGGATVSLPRGVTVSGSTRPQDTPAGTVRDFRFEVQLNLLEAIPGLRGRF